MKTELNYPRIHAAMSKVGEKLEAERLARIAARDARQIVIPGTRTCGHPGARRYMNSSACPDCTPAKLAGHDEPPTPRCNKPIACYLPCCVKPRPSSDELRHEYDDQVLAWRARAKAEIMVLARLGTFGPAELAGLLPINLARARAREWVLNLLDDGVRAGVLVQVDRSKWRARRPDEPVQHVEPSGMQQIVDADRVERDNRYQ